MQPVTNIRLVPVVYQYLETSPTRDVELEFNRLVRRTDRLIQNRFTIRGDDQLHFAGCGRVESHDALEAAVLAIQSILKFRAAVNGQPLGPGLNAAGRIDSNLKWRSAERLVLARRVKQRVEFVAQC